MYKAFFGLKEKPFGKTPDPRFLYLGQGHEEALARLEHVLEEREIAVLTGGGITVRCKGRTAGADQHPHP